MNINSNIRYTTVPRTFTFSPTGEYFESPRLLPHVNDELIVLQPIIASQLALQGIFVDELIHHTWERTQVHVLEVLVLEFSSGILVGVQFEENNPEEVSIGGVRVVQIELRRGVRSQRQKRP